MPPSGAEAASLQRIAEGREAEIFAFGEGRALRLFRTPRSAAALEREIAAMRAAHEAGAPVPAVFETIEVDGRPGMVMQRVDGPDLLTRLGRAPWTVRAVARTTGELQARMHAARAPALLPALRDVATVRIRSLTGVPELAGFALARLASLPDGDAVLHGDFHPGNVIAGADGPLIIDWPNATRGDAEADVARTELLLRLGEPPPTAPFLVRRLAGLVRGDLLRAHMRAYERLRPLDRARVRAWLAVRAVERLAEGIAEERGRLLLVIDRLMREGA
jgi:aminoglycoside phosphotransferase (APT) family kinase protein